MDISATTVHLVAELGFDAVRIEDICRAAGVGRSTFFRYFDSKDASFVAGVYEGRLDAVLAALDEQPEDVGALDALIAAFMTVVDDGWKELRDVLELQARISATSTSVQARASAENRQWTESLAQRIEHRLAGYRDTALVARILASAVLTVVEIISERWLTQNRRYSPIKMYRSSFDDLRQLMGSYR